MKTGVLDSKMNFHELPFYEIEGLCEKIAEKSASLSDDYKEKYEEYKKNITRFSAAFEFCLHELGWMLYDPFTLGNDEVLFSNGERCYIASMDFVKKEGFNRKDVQNKEVGYPRLDDTTIGYDPNISITSINQGIVDSEGYVDSSFADSLDTLADIEVMFENISSKDAYQMYMSSKNYYQTKLEYITSRPNTMSAQKLPDGNISLQYVSENNGKVLEFINRLKSQDMLAEYIPIKSNEETSIVKAA
ncbi:MAG: hypothetical protein OSJ65_03745 [Bacilli bacterium]|nr:hypothetical protein [Bacilli bacterium]